MEEISVLSVRIGVKYLEMHYDEQMQKKIHELSMNGYDVKDAKQCGTEYMLWMNRKRREAGPPKMNEKIDVTPEYTNAMRTLMEEEISRVVGRREAGKI